MEKNLFIFNFKRWPGAVIVALGLLLATEGVARHFADHIRSFSDGTILYKKAFVENTPGLHLDGLIMGDSLSLGMDAAMLSRQISAQLHRDFSVYNLSLPAQGVESHYLLLRKYLRTHPAPQVIFFAVLPQSWTGEENFVRKNQMMSTGLHRFCLLFSVAEGAAVFPAYFLPKFLIAKIERLSFLLTYRQMIRNFLEKYSPDYVPEPSLGSVTTNMNGGVRFGIGTPPTEDMIRSSPEYTNVFVSDPGILRWYEKFFRLAEEQGIRVVIFNAPLVDEIYQVWEKNGSRQSYEHLQEALAARFPRVSLLVPLLQPYDRTLFRDVHHLNGPGFQRFSREFAKREWAPVLAGDCCKTPICGVFSSFACAASDEEASALTRRSLASGHFATVPAGTSP